MNNEERFGSARITIEAGLLAVMSIRVGIEAYCFDRRLECSIHDLGGILVHTLTIEIMGTESTLYRAKLELEHWLGQYRDPTR